MKQGLLITFEGLDKVGKSTQVEKLVDLLNSKGVKTTVVREPGSTEISEKIRKILLDKYNSGLIASMTEMLLYSAARAQLVKDVIKPKLAEGEIVIADRYYDSTTAYQGYGRGIDIEFINKVNINATGGLVPDLTVLLVIDRSSANSKEGIKRFSPTLFDDRLEREFIDFRIKVQDGFKTIAEKEPERFLVIDASYTIKTIFRKISKRVTELLESD